MKPVFYELLDLAIALCGGLSCVAIIYVLVHP